MVEKEDNQWENLFHTWCQVLILLISSISMKVVILRKGGDKHFHGFFFKFTKVSNGIDFIFIVVYSFLKISHILTCCKVYTASHITSLFFKEAMHLHGVPKIIVFNWDAKFLTYFSKTLQGKLGTKLLFSTTYHSETNGQIVVVNRRLTTILQAIVKKDLNNWEERILYVKFTYNKIIHSIIKYSLFKIIHGFNLLSPIDLIPLFV